MRTHILARLLGSTIIAQAVLSGSSFVVAYLLLQNLGSEPYGYYVLINAGLALLTTAQSAFFHPPIVTALAGKDLRERQTFVSATMHARRQLALWLGAAALALTALAWLGGQLSDDQTLMIAAAIFAGIAVSWREFNRSVLLGHHRMGDVLRGDLVYALLLVIFSSLAVKLQMRAITGATAGIGLAALTSGGYMARMIWCFEPWTKDALPDIFRRLRVLGAWSLYGASIHWTFTQGYTYIVAAMLDVRAVGVIAATRLLLMPINMLTSGVGNALYPLVTRWNGETAGSILLQRVAKIVAILTAISVAYVVAIWLAREWLFKHIIHQNAEEGTTLLLLWSAVFVLLLVRDLFNSVVLVRTGFKATGHLTFLSAVLALVGAWLAIPKWGAEGALIGMLAGELFNFLGGLVLLYLAMRPDRKN